MGDCASRVSQSELEAHKRDYNSKNDTHFQAIPYESSINQSISEELSVRALEEKRKIYARKIIDYKNTLNNTPIGVPPIPELNIEVQKGINMFTPGLCINQGNPYVNVRLEPKGPSFDTFASDLYKPYWYKLFQFKQSLHNFTKIVFTVYRKKNMRADEFYGEFQININDLEDQIVLEEWYQVKMFEDPDEKPPAVRVRLQLVHNQRLLLEKMIKRCEEKINLIQIAKANIQPIALNES